MSSSTKFFLYTIYDRKTLVCSSIFQYSSDAEILRLFRRDVNTKGNNFNEWPSDYVLLKLGEFYNTLAGLDYSTYQPIKIYDKPEVVSEALDLVDKKLDKID